MRDLDVKPTPLRDPDIKRDYQLILRYEIAQSIQTVVIFLFT